MLGIVYIPRENPEKFAAAATTHSLESKVDTTLLLILCIENDQCKFRAREMVFAVQAS